MSRRQKVGYVHAQISASQSMAAPSGGLTLTKSCMYIIQTFLLTIAEAGHVPLTLTFTSPSKSSRVPLISTGGWGAVDVDFLVKSFQDGNHDFAGAGSVGGSSCGRSGVENDVRRM